MAKLTPHGISGTIGNITYSVIKGKQILKGKPIRVKQTQATKASAGKFALAACCARRVRERLRSFINPFNDLNMRNRLTSAVYEWVLSQPFNTNQSLDPVSPLIGFDLNDQSPMRKYLAADVQVGWSEPGRVLVNLPAINPRNDIKAPRNTCSIDIWLCMTSFLLEKLSIESSRTHMVQIPYREESIAPKEFEFNVKLLPDSMHVLSMGLRYNVAVTGAVLPESNVKWLPVNLIDAKYMGKSEQ